MVAIQLDLFSGASIIENSLDVKQKTESVTLSELPYDICPRGEVDGTFNIDPCRGCPLKEWCSDDDCAQKLYPIDVDKPLDISFEDWLCEWDF